MTIKIHNIPVNFLAIRTEMNENDGDNRNVHECFLIGRPELAIMFLSKCNCTKRNCCSAGKTKRAPESVPQHAFNRVLAKKERKKKSTTAYRRYMFRRLLQPFFLLNIMSVSLARSLSNDRRKSSNSSQCSISAGKSTRNCYYLLCSRYNAACKDFIVCGVFSTIKVIIIMFRCG